MIFDEKRRLYRRCGSDRGLTETWFVVWGRWRGNSGIAKSEVKQWKRTLVQLVFSLSHTRWSTLGGRKRPVDCSRLRTDGLTRPLDGTDYSPTVRTVCQTGLDCGSPSSPGVFRTGLWRMLDKAEWERVIFSSVLHSPVRPSLALGWDWTACLQSVHSWAGRALTFRPSLTSDGTKYNLHRPSNLWTGTDSGRLPRHRKNGDISGTQLDLSFLIKSTIFSGRWQKLHYLVAVRV